MTRVAHVYHPRDIAHVCENMIHHKVLPDWLDKKTNFYPTTGVQMEKVAA
jgi:hypothetical protein